MSDVTQVDDDADENAKTSKAVDSPTGENGVEGKISRMVVHAVWAQNWMAANPGATPEARKAAWAESRKETMDKNLKIYRRAIANLQRAGLTMSLSDAAAGKAEG